MLTHSHSHSLREILHGQSTFQRTQRKPKWTRWVQYLHNSTQTQDQDRSRNPGAVRWKPSPLHHYAALGSLLGTFPSKYFVTKKQITAYLHPQQSYESFLNSKKRWQSKDQSTRATVRLVHTLLFIYMLNFSLAPHVTMSNISIWHSHSGFLIHKSRSHKPTSLCLREVTGDSSWVCANKAWATQENMAGIHTGINTAAYISIKNPLVWILLPKNTQPAFEIIIKTSQHMYNLLYRLYVFSSVHLALFRQALLARLLCNNAACNTIIPKYQQQ